MLKRATAHVKKSYKILKSQYSVSVCVGWTKDYKSENEETTLELERSKFCIITSS